MALVDLGCRCCGTRIVRSGVQCVHDQNLEHEIGEMTRISNIMLVTSYLG